MNIPYHSDAPSPFVVNEIRYYSAFSALKRLLEQGKITTENCQTANVALAEKYGVLRLNI